MAQQYWQQKSNIEDQSQVNKYCLATAFSTYLIMISDLHRCGILIDVLLYPHKYIIQHMLKDYLIKLRRTVDESTFIVPYSFETFLTSITLCVNNIQSAQITPEIIEKMGSIYKFYKNKTGLDYHELHSEKLHSQLSDLLLPFQKYIPNDDIFKSMINHFRDRKFLQSLSTQKSKTDQLMKLYKEKGNKIHFKGNHELSYVFWINHFKTDYAVHFDIFWNQFEKYMGKIDYFNSFINESSKSKIKRILDPDGKFYVTSANSNDLFVCLSDPKFLFEIAEEVSLKKKPISFKSCNTLKLLFRRFNPNQSVVASLSIKSQDSTGLINPQPISNFPEQEIISITGQSIRCSIDRKENRDLFEKQQILIENKYAPTIRFGSLTDNQFNLKSPFVSRKQFMIIQQSSQSVNEEKDHDPQKYSLVCLSPSNYTIITYNRKTQLKPGMIFKVNGELIEVINIKEQFEGVANGEDSINLFNTISEQEPTLEYLPHQRSVKTMKSLTYMFLNGKNKNMKSTCHSLNNKIVLSSGYVITLNFDDDTFYIPAETQLLAKTANQVLSGHMSDKIKLQSKMKIRLEGIQFEIVEISSNQ